MTVCYGLVFVMWCLTETAANTDSYCRAYRPVMWSSRDTRQTKEQVDRNNRVYKAICR